ncbi:Octamer-binding transcription factor [Quillaja saponaria]|nr:Octamer-binding transcription factor [Quillaja saponaria]
MGIGMKNYTSEGPPFATAEYKALTVEQTSGNQNEKSMFILAHFKPVSHACVPCGAQDSLMHCDDCHQPYPLQYLDQSHKHVCHYRRLCGGCMKQDSSTSLPVQKPSRPKTKEHLEDFDLTDIVQNSLLTKSPGKDTSGKDVADLSLAETSLQNLTDPKIGSRSREKFGTGYDGVSSKFSTVCSVSCSVLERPTIEITDPLPKDGFITLCGEINVQTKLTLPLITFSQRYKRKKFMDGVVTQSNVLLEEENCSLLTKWINHTNDNAGSCELTSCMDHLANFKQSRSFQKEGNCLMKLRLR